MRAAREVPDGLRFLFFLLIYDHIPVRVTPVQHRCSSAILVSRGFMITDLL